YHYFLGHKDHSGLPFTSLVPRSVADWMVSSSGADGHTSNGKFFHKAQRKYRTYTYTLWGYTKLLRRAGFDRIASYWAWQSYSYPRMSGSLDAASIRYMALNLAQSLNRSWQKWLVRLALALPDSALSLLVKLFSPDFLIVAGRDHAGEGSLQDRILDGAPAGAPFVRVSHASSPTLDTTYLRLDRKANAARTIRVTPRTPLPPAPQSLVLAGEEGTAGRLLRLSDKGDITLAARWLSDFQHRSEKGQWTDEQLAAEIRTLTAAASDLPEFEALRQPLMEFEAEYVHALKSARLPIVTEQGSFIPLNIIITPEGDVCPADWRFSSEQGMPLMDIGGLYLSLLRRASRSVRSGKRQPVDGPAAWFAQEFQRPMGLPFSMAPVYYLLRVIQRVKEGREAVPSRQSAYAELSGLLNFVLVPNSSTEDL
ncbi:MAG: hypothetical protein ACM3QS_14685, partial [Bacteroidota bacterium]